MKTDLPPKPRIIVRRGRVAVHHGGAWKVAYADFVTTMMALFIVLWIVGQNAGTREAVGKYFRDPGALPHKSGTSLVPGYSGLLPGRAPGERASGDPEDQVREERALQQAAENFRGALEQKGMFETLKKQVTIEMTPEGLRIELREQDATPFFRLGSAIVLPEMKPVLEDLARAMAALPNHITIEGHTDSRQYYTRENYSNWELSSDRTNSARRIMEAAGLAPGRIDRLVGHADRVPVVPEDPLNAMNRRITIIVRRLGQA